MCSSRPKTLSSSLAQAGRFFLVGATTTVLYFLVVWLVTWGTNYSVGAAAALGAAVAIAVNFTLQRIFTFRSSRRIAQSIPRYLFVQAVGAALNAGTLLTLVDSGRLPYPHGQAIGVVLYISWSFLAQKYWAFRDDAP